LYHYLTGDRRARETVLQMAEWIITMDDGSQHMLGLVSDVPTGRASVTCQQDYHGPGRGAGNAIGVLIDAWLADGESRYIEFAEELIRRTVHPQDDIAARELNNFELRWSYTVYLQQLARYLHLTESVDRPGEIREYAAASLLHYANWMVDNDQFYLDHPNQLEYPTETWAAQELRKGNVLFAASQFANANDCERYRRHGEQWMERAWHTLMSFESRFFTRPMAIVLQQSYIESYHNGAEQSYALRIATTNGSAARCHFKSQRDEIRSHTLLPLLLKALARVVMRPARLWAVWRRSWHAECVRRLRE
jgi:hypothetical protein